MTSALPLNFPLFSWLAAALRPQASQAGNSAPSTPTTREDKVVAFVDPDEYTRIVDQFYRPLYLFALSLARNEHDAWDLTHDTFLKWVGHQHRIRDRARTKTWLFTTLYRQFLDHARKRGRHATFEADTGAPPEAMPSNAAPATVPDARSLDRAHVMRLLQGLPENYRAAITLFYLEDCSYKEIARILDVRIGTVMSRLARGRQLLADRLEQAPSAPSPSTSES